MRGNMNVARVKRQKRNADNAIKDTVVIYAVPCILAIVCYANGLQGPFLHDDLFAIKQNNDVTGPTSLYQVFTNDFWGVPMNNKTSHKSYRPLCILTFRLDYSLSGGSPVWFHIVNTALHACVTGLLTAVCLRVLHTPRLQAIITSSTFATHPVHTEAVTGLVGRADVLAALLFLLSFFFYSRCMRMEPTEIRDLNYNKALSRQPWVLQGATFLASMALAGSAMLCKETGATVLLVCMVYDLLCHGTHVRRYLKFRCWSTKLTPVAVRCLLVTLTTVVLLYARMWVMEFQRPVFPEDANPAAHSSFLTKFLTYLYLPILNFWLLLYPAHLCYDWSGGSVPLLRTLSDPRNVLSLAFYGLAALLTWKCLRYWWKQCEIDDESESSPSSPSPPSSPTLSPTTIPLLSIGLMVASFLPASNLLFPVGLVVAERVLYIPSMGFCLLMSHGLVAMSRRLSSLRYHVMVACLVVLLAALGGRTWERNKVWNSRHALYRSGVQTMPDNAKLHYNMANVLKDEGDHQQAEHHYRMAVKLNPLAASYHLNLGTVLKNETESEQCYREALRLRPGHTGALVNLGNILIGRGQERSGLSLIQRALDIDPDHVESLLVMGYFHTKKHDYPAAEIYIQRALGLRPESGEVHLCYAHFLQQTNQIDHALQEYTRTLELNPTVEQALLNKAVILNSKGHYSMAVELLERAQRLNHQCSECLKQLAYIHSKQNNTRAAVTYIAQAHSLQPNNTSIHLRYVHALKKAKRGSEAWKELESLFLKRSEDLGVLDYAFRFAMETADYERAMFYGREKVTAARKGGVGPKDLSKIYFDQGEACRKGENLDDAIQAYNAALELEPGLLDIRNNLCGIYFMKNHLDEATRCYNKTLEFDHNNKLAHEHLQKIKNLRENTERERR